MTFPMRSLTEEEEVRLADVVLNRDLFSMEAAEWTAAQMEVAPDLVELVRAGLSCEHVDPPLKGEGGKKIYYEWKMPDLGSRH